MFVWEIHKDNYVSFEILMFCYIGVVYFSA